MAGVVQDLRFSARGVRRQPGFSATVVLTLGLTIGATTAMFSVVNGSLLRSLPFHESESLVFLQGAFDAPEGPQVRGASVPEATDWAAMARSFERVVPFDGASLTMTGLETPEK